jgi:hypothetical protein
MFFKSEIDLWRGQALHFPAEQVTKGVTQMTGEFLNKFCTVIIFQ